MKPAKTKVVLQAPKLDRPETYDHAELVLSDDRAFEKVLLSGDSSGLTAKGMTFDEAILEKVRMASAVLEKLGITDAQFRACDLSAAKCADSSINRVVFRGSRMTGIDLSQALVQDAIFEECKLDLSNFRFAKFKRVKFTDCELTEADFQGAEFIDVSFENSQIERVEFSSSHHTRTNLSGSTLIGIRGWASLKGVTIDAVQLMAVSPELAATLGIKIAD